MIPVLEADFIKRFENGPEIRVDRLSLKATDGVAVLFGTSGSGKTTLLRCVAGLERPDTGTIRFGGVTWVDTRANRFLPARSRNIGFVPQDYALFPHLTVSQNVGYGLKHCSPSERRDRVQEILDRVELETLGERYPDGLSGGQQQRVALARAVVRQPNLLLLDEPLAALDTPTRRRLREYLRRLLIQLSIPTLVVTHDRTEAVMLGDQLVIMDQGRIRQTGLVADVFSRPVDLQVAASVGMETIQPGEIVATEDGLAIVDVNGLRFRVLARDLAKNTREVYIAIRAEDVVIARDGNGPNSPRNRLLSIVRSLRKHGPLVRIELDCGFPLVALLTKQACEELSLEEGARVVALVKTPQIHLIPRFVENTETDNAPALGQLRANAGPPMSREGPRREAKPASPGTEEA